MRASACSASTLGLRVVVARSGRIVGTKRAPGFARFAVHLDGAREDEPAHSRAHRGGRDARGRRHVRRRVRGPRIAGRFVLHVRAPGKMDHGVRAREDRVAIGVGKRCEIGDRTHVRIGCGRLSLPPPDDRTIRPPRGLEVRDERTADEAVGAGDDDEARNPSRESRPRAGRQVRRSRRRAASAVRQFQRGTRDGNIHVPFDEDSLPAPGGATPVRYVDFIGPHIELALRRTRINASAPGLAV